MTRSRFTEDNETQCGVLPKQVGHMHWNQQNATGLGFVKLSQTHSPSDVILDAAQQIHHPGQRPFWRQTGRVGRAAPYRIIG